MEKKSPNTQLCRSCIGLKLAILMSVVLFVGTEFNAIAGRPAWESTGVMTMKYNGRPVAGVPIAMDSSEVKLLRSDGRLLPLDASKLSDIDATGQRFRPASVSAIRAMLLRELGNDYEVVGTSHYIVAQPSGTRQEWSGLFEGLYRDLVRYFQIRKFQASQPFFPLIAVVCKDQAEFLKYSKGIKIAAQPGVMGYYDPESNRIVLYDQSMGDSSNAAAVQMSIDTITHEATHQVLFNIGVLDRFVINPLWILEGTATLFEAEGTRKSTPRDRLIDRINPERLSSFKAYAGKHDVEYLKRMISDDRAFSSNPMRAYGEAWAFTFFLMETEPNKLYRYLQLLARHDPFAGILALTATRRFRVGLRLQLADAGCSIHAIHGRCEIKATCSKDRFVFGPIKQAALNSCRIFQYLRRFREPFRR